MDFLDPKKKRAHRQRLFIGYVLMAIALVIGTILLFLEVNGLSLHPSTGTVTQNGLVFIDAHPESATAYLNGQQKGNTDLRLVLPTGDYNLELKRDGYRTWKHTFTLEGSSIERLVYPFLFPEKLVSKDVQLYAAPPALATESPDRHWLIVQQAGNLTSFDIVDISNTNGNATTATLPPGLLKTGGTKHVLELVEWSTDNRHVLIKHTYDTGTEFVIYDRETPASSINLNQALGRPIADIALRDKKYDQYYLLDAIGGSLVSMDLKNKQVVPIGGSILAFKSHGPDVLLLVTTEGAPAGEVLVKVRSNLDQYTLRELPTSPIYLIDIARFDNHWYMAAGASVEQKVYIYKDAFDDFNQADGKLPLPISALRTDTPPEFISFSAIARFIAVQAGSQFSVYDAETKRQFRYDTKLQLPEHQKATWMDGHRLATVTKENKLVIFDFDGQNKQTLLDVNAAFLPAFDRDYVALYTISPSVAVPGRTAVVQTDLKIKP